MVTRLNTVGSPSRLSVSSTSGLCGGRECRGGHGSDLSILEASEDDFARPDVRREMHSVQIPHGWPCVTQLMLTLLSGTYWYWYWYLDLAERLVEVYGLGDRVRKFVD